MKDMKPEIIATIYFYKIEEGGRKGATPKDWFGCPFLFKGRSYDCRLFFYGKQPIKPGDRLKVFIQFLCPDLILNKLKVGDKFELWDGRIIAEGKVEEIL